MHALFSYYGSKFVMARRLGPPQRDVIIEPFAGSAGYSCYWQAKKVILVDVDPIIAGLWRYLIKVKEEEILGLSVDIDEVSQLRGACQEAKHLVGFWFNFAEARPLQRRGHWAREHGLRRQFWGERIRSRIAHSLKHIRKWKVIEGHYWKAPDIDAHWHIDPPYQRAGYGYKHGNRLDYSALGAWCRTRPGFVQVCEHTSADWLPFVEFARTRGNTGKNRRKRYSAEGVFQSGQKREDFNFPEIGESNGSTARTDQGNSKGKKGAPRGVRGAEARRPKSARRAALPPRSSGQAQRRRVGQAQPEGAGLVDHGN